MHKLSALVAAVVALALVACAAAAPAADANANAPAWASGPRRTLAQLPGAAAAPAAKDPYLDNVVSVTCLLDAESGALLNLEYTTGAGKSDWLIPSGPKAAGPSVDSVTHDLRLAGSITTVMAGYRDAPARTWHVAFGTTSGVFRTCGAVDYTANATRVTYEVAPKGKGLRALKGVKCAGGVCEGVRAAWGAKQLTLVDTPAVAGGGAAGACPVNSEAITFDPATHGSCAALAASRCVSLAELRVVNAAELNTDAYCAALQAGDKLCVPAWRCCGAGLHKVTYHASLGRCGKLFKTLGVGKKGFAADNPGISDLGDYCKHQLRSGVTAFCARSGVASGDGVTCPANTKLVTYTSDMGYCFAILQNAGLTQEQFLAINPWITDYNSFCNTLQSGVTTFCLPSNNGCPDGSYRATWQNSYGRCNDMQQKWGLDKATFEKYNKDVTYDAFCSDLEDGLTKFCLPNGVGPGPNPPTPIPSKRIFLFFAGGWAGGAPPALTSLPNADNVNLFVAGYFASDRKSPSDPSTGNYNWIDTWKSGVPFSYQKNQILSWKAAAPAGTTRKFLISVNGDQFYWQTPGSVDAWVKNAVASLTNLMDTYGMDGVEWNIENFAQGSTGFVDATCGVFQGLKAANPAAVTILDTYQWVDLGQTLPVWNKCKASIDFLNYQTYGGAFQDIQSDVDQWLATADSLIYNRWPADVVPKLIFSFSTALPQCTGAPSQRGIVDPTKAAQVATAMMNKGAAGAFTWTAEWSKCSDPSGQPVWNPAYALEIAVQNVIKTYT